MLSRSRAGSPARLEYDVQCTKFSAAAVRDVWHRSSTAVEREEDDRVTAVPELPDVIVDNQNGCCDWQFWISPRVQP
jgi:hypothetical protein